MVDMSGIPRGFDVGAIRRELAELKREVALLASRRNYVALDRIVEGGTIDAGVGDKLTETVQEKIVVERQNLAEAALTDVIVTGSITTRGETYETPPRQMDVSLTTFSRNIGGNLTSNPGVIFQAEGEEESLAPGIYSPDGRLLYFAAPDGEGSSSTFQLGRIAAVMAPRFVVGGVLNPLVDANTATSSVTLGYDGLFGKHNVDLVGNVKVNGAAYGTPQERVQPQLNAGWSQWTSASWNGIWIEQMGKLTIISGAVGKASWTGGETIASLPVRFRPANKASGNNCEVQANGNLNIGAAGTGASALSITYFSA